MKTTILIKADNLGAFNDLDITFVSPTQIKTIKVISSKDRKTKNNCYKEIFCLNLYRLSFLKV